MNDRDAMLGLYQQVLFAERWPGPLTEASRRFRDARGIGRDELIAESMRRIFAAHHDRVMGRGSPALCDTALRQEIAA